MLKKSKILKLIIASIIFVILAACANIQAPSGGPPDTTPPTILSNSPENLSTNFTEDKVVLEFSKYMNKTNVIENLFISPSINTEYKWKGKKLIVEFDDELEPNTTYSLQLGTEYTDYYNNKPAKAYSVVFSTGSIIDTGSISGKLYGEKVQGCFIFAYRIDKINPDTLNFADVVANYKVQVGSNGSFEITALADGVYRLIAVEDQFKDFKYDAGSDRFGASLSDVEVKNGKSAPIRLKINGREDIQAPTIYTAEKMNSRRIDISLSEPIDFTSISKQTYVITDSLKTKSYEILESYPFLVDSARIGLILKDNLDEELNYLSFGEEMLLSDTLNHKVELKEDRIKIKNKKEYSPAKLEYSSIFPEDSSKRVDPRENIRLVSNYPIELDSNTLIQVFDMKDTILIDIDITQKYSNFISIKSKADLKNDNTYLVKIFGINPKYDFIETISDTTFISFETDDLRNYSDVSGVINSLPKIPGNWYLLMSSKSGKLVYEQKLDTEEWSFRKVMAGEYKFEVYKDTDLNGRYSYGKSKPFEFAEEFFLLSKTINVRTGWDVEDVILEYEIFD